MSEPERDPFPENETTNAATPAAKSERRPRLESGERPSALYAVRALFIDALDRLRGR